MVWLDSVVLVGLQVRARSAARGIGPLLHCWGRLNTHSGRRTGGLTTSGLGAEGKVIHLCISSVLRHNSCVVCLRPSHAQMDDLTRERDILNKNYIKAQGSTSKQADWVKIKENQKKNLDQVPNNHEHQALWRPS